MPEYIKGVTGIKISQMTRLSKNTASEWKNDLHNQLADWLLANPSHLGGPGVIDGANFGDHRYNVGRYRVALTRAQ